MSRTRVPDPLNCAPDDNRPQAGHAQPGREFTPGDLDEATPSDERPASPTPAPAPGTPVSPAEYQRLKDTARRRQKTPEAPAHEDPPRRGRDNDK